MLQNAGKWVPLPDEKIPPPPDEADDAGAVPEAAATTAANAAQPVNEPLADAGVAPDVVAPRSQRPTVVDPDRIPPPPKQ
jgi:hypothetical protein